jgi:predicted nucleic acid-binding protein
MKSLFLDTSFFVALEGADDQYHEQAFAYWQSLRTSSPVLVTTSYVFDEVVTLFNRRGRHARAVEIGNRLLESPLVSLVHVDEAIFDEAWRYFARHSDKSYSLTDCVSFVVMKRLRIRTALTFDRHFAQAGFERRPGGGK